MQDENQGVFANNFGMQDNSARCFNKVKTKQYKIPRDKSSARTSLVRVHHKVRNISKALMKASGVWITQNLFLTVLHVFCLQNSMIENISEVKVELYSQSSKHQIDMEIEDINSNFFRGRVEQFLKRKKKVMEFGHKHSRELKTILEKRAKQPNAQLNQRQAQKFKEFSDLLVARCKYDYIILRRKHPVRQKHFRNPYKLQRVLHQQNFNHLMDQFSRQKISQLQMLGIQQQLQSDDYPIHPHQQQQTVQQTDVLYVKTGIEGHSNSWRFYKYQNVLVLQHNFPSYQTNSGGGIYRLDGKQVGMNIGKVQGNAIAIMFSGSVADDLSKMFERQNKKCKQALEKMSKEGEVTICFNQWNQKAFLLCYLNSCIQEIQEMNRKLRVNVPNSQLLEKKSQLEAEIKQKQQLEHISQVEITIERQNNLDIERQNNLDVVEGYLFYHKPSYFILAFMKNFSKLTDTIKTVSFSNCSLKISGPVQFSQFQQQQIKQFKEALMVQRAPKTDLIPLKAKQFTFNEEWLKRIDKRSYLDGQIDKQQPEFQQQHKQRLFGQNQSKLKYSFCKKRKYIKKLIEKKTNHRP